MGQIAFLGSRQLFCKWTRLHDKPWMTELPTVPCLSLLSDGSQATDPWPGFDLHPIRSTPEGSLIGGLAEGEVEPGGKQGDKGPAEQSQAPPNKTKKSKNKHIRTLSMKGCKDVLLGLIPKRREEKQQLELIITKRCKDKWKRHVIKEVLDVKLMDQSNRLP